VKPTSAWAAVNIAVALARADAERAEGALDRLGPTITPQALKTFARQARRRMRTESGGYRRDHLRTASHARRRLKRKNGGFWRAQFCTEMARPAGFEPATYRLEGGCSIP
jgi:hypothetical protein